MPEHPAIHRSPCSLCSRCTLIHPPGRAVGRFDHTQQHRPRRAAVGGSSSWSRAPAIDERARARPALQIAAPARASPSLNTARCTPAIDAPHTSAHSPHLSLPWTLATIPAAPDTFSLPCIRGAHSFCVIKLLCGTRMLERCLSVCSMMRGIWPLRARMGPVSRCG